MIQQDPLPRIVDATLGVDIIGFTGFEERSESGEELPPIQNQNPHGHSQQREGLVITSTSLNKISDFLFPFLIEPGRKKVICAGAEEITGVYSPCDV